MQINAYLNDSAHPGESVHQDNSADHKEEFHRFLKCKAIDTILLFLFY